MAAENQLPVKQFSWATERVAWFAVNGSTELEPPAQVKMPLEDLRRWSRVLLAGMVAETVEYGGSRGGADDRALLGRLWGLSADVTAAQNEQRRARREFSAVAQQHRGGSAPVRSSFSRRPDGSPGGRRLPDGIGRQHAAGGPVWSTCGRGEFHEPLALGLSGLYRLQLEERRAPGSRGCTWRWSRLSSSRPIAIGPACASRSTTELDPALRRMVLRYLASWRRRSRRAWFGAGAGAFPRVGAMDALVDVVGLCRPAALAWSADLQSAPAGHGQVMSPWPLPVPVPAVLELATRHGVPLAGSAGFPRLN